MTLLKKVPNMALATVPVGSTEDENVVTKTVGEPTKFDFKPLDHVAILEKNNWADFERIAKVSGSRSYSLRNDMVLVEMAMQRHPNAEDAGVEEAKCDDADQRTTIQQVELRPRRHETLHQRAIRLEVHEQQMSPVSGEERTCHVQPTRRSGGRHLA
jgi:hypothetical protein